jgi:hypothetical protein
MNTTTIETNFVYTTSHYANLIKFGILLNLQLFSIPCFLYVFYQFGRQHPIFQSFHHHVIFLSLITSFLFVTIALPLTQAYMYTLYIYPTNIVFSAFWN